MFSYIHYLARESRYVHDETVNTVCLGFSHECSQFSQSQSVFFFLEFLVKNMFRIKYLVSPGKVVLSTCFGEDYLFLAKITFFATYFMEMRLKSVHICRFS